MLVKVLPVGLGNSPEAADFVAQLESAVQTVVGIGLALEILPAQVIEELAGENAGSIKVGKVNIDENPNSAQSYGVQSIPTLMVFKGGDVVERFVGAQPKSRLQQALDEIKV